MAVKKCRVDLDDDHGFTRTIREVVSVEIKNGMVRILSRTEGEIYFRDDNPTLIVEVWLDNGIVQ